MHSFLAFLLSITLAHADVIDRINSCERSGKTDCLFDLLREIAATKNDNNAASFELIPNEGVYCSKDCHNINATVTVGKDWVIKVRNKDTFFDFSGHYHCHGRKCVNTENPNYIVIHRSKLISFHSLSHEFIATWRRP